MKKIISIVLLVVSSFVVDAQRGESGSQRDSLPVNDKDYKNRVMYEVYVRSYFDSDKDSIGDLAGLTSKLGYLKSLGVEGVCIMPVNPSTSNNSNEITDFYNIDKVYGDKKAFSKLVESAHKLHLKVVIDLELNHTSTRHSWFQDAMGNKFNAYRDYFVWKDDKDVTQDMNAHWFTPVKFNGEAIAGQKYYSTYGSTMPDLNFDNPKVREEALRIGKFWANEMKVDGFKINSAEKIFPEDQPSKSIQWWKEFRTEMEKDKKGIYMVGEFSGSVEKSVPYLNHTFDATLDNDLAKWIIKTVVSGVDSGLVTGIVNRRAALSNGAADFIDATFISGNDVDRIATSVNGDLSKARVAASMLFTMPGSPYIYYGDEIGMLGKNPKHMLEPFLWSDAPNAPGVTKWKNAAFSTPQNVKALTLMHRDTSSIYAHYKKLIAIRRLTPALNGKEISSVKLEDKHIVAYIRSSGAQKVLVVNNVSGSEVTFIMPSMIPIGEQIFVSGNMSDNKGKFVCGAYSTGIYRLK